MNGVRIGGAKLRKLIIKLTMREPIRIDDADHHEDRGQEADEEACPPGPYEIWMVPILLDDVHLFGRQLYFGLHAEFALFVLFDDSHCFDLLLFVDTQFVEVIFGKISPFQIRRYKFEALLASLLHWRRNTADVMLSILRFGSFQTFHPTPVAGTPVFRPFCPGRLSIDAKKPALHGASH